MYISITLAATLLFYTTPSEAAAIPQYPENTMSTATGFKNVAYFVNWVSQFTATSYRTKLTLIRQFTGATTIPKIYQQRNLLTFCMPLQMSDQTLARFI